MAGIPRTVLPALPSLWHHQPVTGLSQSHFRLGQEANSNYEGMVSQMWWEVNSVSGIRLTGRGKETSHFSATAWSTQPTPCVVFLGCLEQLDCFPYKKNLLNPFETGFHGDSRNKVVPVFSMTGCTPWTSRVPSLHSRMLVLWWGASVNWISIFPPTRALWI